MNVDNCIENQDFAAVVRTLQKYPEAIAYRAGWKASGQCIFFVPAHSVPLSKWKGDVHKGVYLGKDCAYQIGARFDMFTRDKARVCGWTPSPMEMAAKDWIIE